METLKAHAATLKANVEALDRQILAGDILGAVETFFHPDVETQEGNAADVTR